MGEGGRHWGKEGEVSSLRVGFATTWFKDACEG